jgi:predicted phosphodiesterase
MNLSGNLLRHGKLLCMTASAWTAALLVCACAIAAQPAPGTTSAVDTTIFARPRPEPPTGAPAAPAYHPQKWVKKQVEEKDCLFLFAVIGDPHVSYAGGQDTRYIKAMDVSPAVLANCVHDINGHSPSVDFAVELGDVADLGMALEFAMGSAIFDSLACPLYAVLGNHDAFQSDHKAGWKAFAKRDSATYAFNFKGMHFIVIDCTLDPYASPFVDCDTTLRDWVRRDLAANHDKPTIVFSHFNMWERHWNPMFDTTATYAEYRGMPELRRVLEEAGNVVAVINGHVHANRVERHQGIYYLDVSATVVGPPSIRYFYVYPDRIEATFSYISDRSLFNRVTALCPVCMFCFDSQQVCEFVDGQIADKEFVMPLGAGADAGVASIPGSDPQAELTLTARCSEAGHIRAVFSSNLVGVLEVSLHDVLGRRLGKCSLWKDGPQLDADLGSHIPGIGRLPSGVYFVRATIGGVARTVKVILLA